MAKTKTRKGKDKAPKQTVFGGLNKSRYAKKGVGADRIQLGQGDSGTFQFVAPITDEKMWKEIWQHQFNDGGWKYVPCLGDDCPLCDDDERDVSKTTYRFFTVVWDSKEKKLAVLEGPKDLSGRIARKFSKAEKRKKGSFLTQTYEITKLKTTPVSYEVDEGGKKAVSIDLKKAPDLDAYIEDQKLRYFGDDLPKSKKGKKKEPKRTALDDDDDAQEDGYDEEELEEMDWSDLKKYAKQLGVKLVDKDGEKRKRPALIKLILKKQD